MRRKSYAKSVVAVAMAATVALSATACGLKSTADTADTSTSQNAYRYASTDCNPGPYGLARPGGIDSRIHR